MNTLVRSVYIPNFSIKLVLFFIFGPHTPLHAHIGTGASQTSPRHAAPLARRTRLYSLGARRRLSAPTYYSLLIITPLNRKGL